MVTCAEEGTHGLMSYGTIWGDWLQWVCCSVLQCCAVRSSVLQCVAVCCSQCVVLGIVVRVCPLIDLVCFKNPWQETHKLIDPDKRIAAKLLSFPRVDLQTQSSNFWSSEFSLTTRLVIVSIDPSNQVSCLSRKTQTRFYGQTGSVLQCVVVYCSVLQCVAVCCSVL